MRAIGTKETKKGRGRVTGGMRYYSRGCEKLDEGFRRDEGFARDMSTARSLHENFVVPFLHILGILAVPPVRMTILAAVDFA